MVKKAKKFNYQKNLKKQWKKMKEKKNPKVNAEQLKGFWDPEKSIQANYRDLGLSYDPNVTIEIPKTKTKLQVETMDIEEAKQLGFKPKQEKEQQQEMDTPALRKLIKDSQIKSDKKHNLNESDVLNCIYFLEKYGDDFKKMAKDHKNYYQDTPAQLKKRINIFKTMKTQYDQYLNDKQSGVNFLKALDD